MEKIDVINGIITIYNNKGESLKTFDISSIDDLDLSHLNGCALFTINLTSPCKRVLKFSSYAEFEEFIYEDLSTEYKLEVDNFITACESKKQ